MQSHQQAIFETFYREHVSRILAYFGRRLPAALAPDATAEVFLVVWRRFDERPTVDAVVPWLYTIAHNVLRNTERSRRRRTRLLARLTALGESHTNRAGADAPVIRNTELQQVVEALDLLPDRDREIVKLVEWDGLERTTVAAMFGISRAAVDQRMSRAYTKLRRNLESEHGPRHPERATGEASV